MRRPSSWPMAWRGRRSRTAVLNTEIEVIHVVAQGRYQICDSAQIRADKFSHAERLVLVCAVILI